MTACGCDDCAPKGNMVDPKIVLEGKAKKMGYWRWAADCLAEKISDALMEQKEAWGGLNKSDKFALSGIVAIPFSLLSGIAISIAAQSAWGLAAWLGMPIGVLMLSYSVYLDEEQGK